MCARVRAFVRTLVVYAQYCDPEQNFPGVFQCLIKFEVTYQSAGRRLWSSNPYCGRQMASARTRHASWTSAVSRKHVNRIIWWRNYTLNSNRSTLSFIYFFLSFFPFNSSALTIPVSDSRTPILYPTSSTKSLRFIGFKTKQKKKEKSAHQCTRVNTSLIPDIPRLLYEDHVFPHVNLSLTFNNQHWPNITFHVRFITKCLTRYDLWPKLFYFF